MPTLLAVNFLSLAEIKEFVGLKLNGAHIVYSMTRRRIKLQVSS